MIKLLQSRLVIVTKLNCRYVVGMWSVCGGCVVGMWSVKVVGKVNRVVDMRSVNRSPTIYQQFNLFTIARVGYFSV